MINLFSLRKNSGKNEDSEKNIAALVEGNGAASPVPS
jgi:hypothetical protein